MFDLLFSLLSLGSLIVILHEEGRGRGFRRRWPITMWALSLAGLALLVLAKLIKFSGSWSEMRILMGILAAGNFVVGAALLFGWLYWTRATSSTPR